MRADAERLRDVLEAIERIERYAGGRTDAFEKNELIQNWVVSHIQVIGEACSRVSDAIQARHPEIPWTKIVGMRNILVHNYFEIDVDAVKAVLESDLPVLKPQVEAILDELGGELESLADGGPSAGAPG